VLLVDNADSYTYDLHHLLGRVTGEAPVTVPAAGLTAPGAPLLEEVRGGAFDLVVVSPGPGVPWRAGDFAGSARALAAARAGGRETPVLGVCLGHQGLAAVEGAAVVPAPAPRHGHVSALRHRGAGLFAGVPQGSGAVRYHSWCVAALPPSCRPLAWAEDGVLMALEVVGSPRWGVQYHPESVATEHGEVVVANAVDLARRWVGRREARPPLVPSPRPPAPRPAAPRPAAPRARAPRPPALALHVRRLAGAADAAATFRALFAGARAAFWLDSGQVAPAPGGTAPARFSYLGDADGPLGEVLRYRVDGGVLSRATATGTVVQRGADVFAALAERLAAEPVTGPVDGPPVPFAFRGGWVGHLGYELKALTGGSAAHRSPTPDACWLRPDRMVVVDHHRDQTHLVALARAGAPAPAAVLDELERGLRHRAPPPPPPAAPATATWASGDAGYRASVAAAQAALVAGESYEVCLTTAASVPATGEPGEGLAVHERLRALTPAPFAAYLRVLGDGTRDGAGGADDVEVVCASPERFLRVDRDGGVEARPIKGTAPRGADPGADAALRAGLAASAKDRAESLMVVDLLRHDLGRVCALGSVEVPRLMAVETYPAVHQLVSTVTGRLDAGRTALDAVRAAFPPGSMTGAPKVRTMAVIDALEPEARGVYSGAVGFLSADGACDLDVVIRAAVREPAAGGRPARWRVGAGGGVVLASDPAAELAEVHLKARAVLAALGVADAVPARVPDGAAGG
jgi:para-aminobenzoate synthetase